MSRPLSFVDLHIVIENPKGSAKAFRRASAGHPGWKDYPLTGVAYPVDYGFIEGFTGEDGMGLDIFVGSGDRFGCFTMGKVGVPSETTFFARVTEAERDQILAAFAPVLLASKALSEAAFMAEIERFRASR
jgi:inorganic pyrophosphatase